ncbi:MAG: UDP-N-acetylmuramoyl-L-alanine--D-glutamate ligase [Patescibacteria group bacterium]
MINLKNKKIALLGLGIENQELLKILLSENKDLNVCVCDKRNKKELKKILGDLKIKNLSFKTGDSFNNGLEKFDILFRSPGWPISCPGVQKALEKNVELSSPMNVFFNLCPSKNIIGVTGSKGKGTTASLIFEILKEDKKRCFLGGNIGVAPLGFLKKIKKNDFIILELSSFQLEDLMYSPKIAIITNIFPEHLSPADLQNPNFHKNYSSYIGAKLNIAAYQSKQDFLIVNKRIKKIIDKYKIKSTIKYFSKSKTENILIGDFNKENIAAAEEVAKVLKIKKDKVEKVLKSFKNLENRLELVREIAGIRYYNNSFSTTPESTIADLKSFKKNIVLLAGGADKGSSFKNLSLEIKKRVKTTILFPGEGSNKIKKEFKKINYTKVRNAKSMSEAIKIAKKEAKTNDIVLLSTACASFGLFKNYKERGKLFKEEVSKL